MKNFISLILFGFLQTQISYAAETQCQKDFGNNVSTCVQSLNALGLTGPERADATKNCIKDAKTAKVACENGSSLCESTCQNTYNSATAACQQAYTTDYAACGTTNAICQLIVETQRTECLDTAQSELNICKANCQQ